MWDRRGLKLLQMLSFWRMTLPPWSHLLATYTVKTWFSKSEIFALCWNKDGFRVEYGRWCRLWGTVQGWHRQAICYSSTSGEPKKHGMQSRQTNTLTSLYPVLHSSCKHRGWNRTLFNPRGKGLAYIVAEGDKQTPLYFASCESAATVQK